MITVIFIMRYFFGDLMNTKLKIFFLLLVLAGPNLGQKQMSSLKKNTFVNTSSTFLNSNNISTIFYNDGISDNEGKYYNTYNSRFEYPKGSGKNAVFISGLLWGAITHVNSNSRISIGGSAFSSGLQPGKILENGDADDPALAKYRIYRVRNDVYPGAPRVDLSNEIADENDTYENIKNRYETDWMEWPADDGAPFLDKNANGVYEPSIDVPGIENSRQTIWFVANDLNEELIVNNYYTSPLGVELQVTIWTYDIEPVLSNMFFKKYVLINKSQNEFHDMYISYWADTDIGDAGNDFVGTDTLNNMVYGYNAEDTDDFYNPMVTPAVGFQLLQGPIVAGNAGEDKNKNGVDDASDFAIYNNESIGPGFINLPMTASYYYYPYSFPPGVDADYAYWKFLDFQGRVPEIGEPYTDPNTLAYTHFPLSGDPVTQTGWIDGQVYPSGDKSIGFGSGPFNLAAGDTQEVVVAQIAALSSNRFNSIELLKTYAARTQAAYAEFTIPPKVPSPPSPEVTITDSLEGILIKWDNNQSLISEIENFNQQGYQFQGYNVYQKKNSKDYLESDSPIFVFDIVDGITNIQGEIRDSVTGFPVKGVKQHGSDRGIERSVFIDKDKLTGTPLIKGKAYIFAVSTFTYNQNPLNEISTTESPLNYFSIKYLSNLPGANYGDPISHVQTAGKGSDGTINVTVADPEKLTGNDYEIFFTEGDSLNGDAVKYWNMRNINLNDTVLTNQTVMNGIDIYTNEITENPLADGLEINVNVNYGMPNTFSDLQLNNNSFERDCDTCAFEILDNYTYVDTPAISANSRLGIGTSDISLLEKDYKIIFDGVLEIVNINGFNVEKVKSGGQTATLYDAGFYSLKDHPLNPNPGSNNPFTISVPFKVFNAVDNRQINIMVYDRNTSLYSWDTLKIWNPERWYYTSFVMSDYHQNVIDTSTEAKNFATWDLLWRKSEWQRGDEIYIEYPSPITTDDKFTFKAPNKFVKEYFRVFDKFDLSQNYPNPFNPVTTIRFVVPQESKVKLEVFNILGQKLTTLVNRFFDSGTHEVQFNGRGLSSGVYFYRIESGTYVDVKKMILLK
jgi:type IX secretion system substrate protein